MIQYQPAPVPVASPRFSILIPSWNNLPLLQLCVRSVRTNSRFTHQVIVHVNEGQDGTLDWVRDEGLDFTYSATNVGVCLACNAAYSLARAEYIVYLNDDMYACPDWDAALWGAIEAYGRPDFYFSGTAIERVDSGVGFISSPHDFGDSAETFREADLLAALPTLAIPDWQGSNFPPSVMHRRYWDLIGGFSIEFSPGMYSDPDLCRKLYAVGVRNFRGVGTSLVYHFMSKSVSRIRKNNGRRQFMQKWGLSARAFFDYYLGFWRRPDIPYRGVLPPEPPETWALRRERWLSALKKRF
jgi:glycosyltransferase involved in cell wall biosynthesis